MLRIFYSTAFLTLVLVMIFAGPAAAQVEAATGDLLEINYFDFFVRKGGPITFGLIALSVVTVALTIEHCLSIRRATIIPIEAARHTKVLMEKKDYLGAIKFTAENPSMLGHVLHAGLLDASNGFAAMERALEDMLDERSARLFRKTQYLNIIGNISPMIGLLGTVTGMILLFAEIHAADAFPGARIVADRIAVALITTFWGLAVAIPAMSIYAVFRNRIDVLTAECAVAAENILSVFKPGESASAETGILAQPTKGKTDASPK